MGTVEGNGGAPSGGQGHLALPTLVGQRPPTNEESQRMQSRAAAVRRKKATVIPPGQRPQGNARLRTGRTAEGSGDAPKDCQKHPAWPVSLGPRPPANGLTADGEGDAPKGSHGFLASASAPIPTPPVLLDAKPTTTV